MASFDDLGRALRDDAVANAPRASAIDVDAVTAAARARRRPRQWAVGTLSVVAALGLGGLAIGAVTPPTLIAASESADLEAGAEDSEVAPLADGGDGGRGTDDLAAEDLLACGVVTSPPSTQDDGLELDLRGVPSAVAGDAGVGAGAVLINNGPSVITVVTATTAVAALTQNGEVVGHQLARDTASLEFDLAPGESRELPLQISTADCRSAALEPLASGTYAAVAVLDVLDALTGERTLIVAPAVELRLD